MLSCLKVSFKKISAFSKEKFLFFEQIFNAENMYKNVINIDILIRTLPTILKVCKISTKFSLSNNRPVLLFLTTFTDKLKILTNKCKNERILRQENALSFCLRVCFKFTFKQC